MSNHPIPGSSPCFAPSIVLPKKRQGDCVRLIGLFIVAAMFVTGCQSKPEVIYQIHPTFGVEDPQFRETINALLGPQLLPGNQTVTLLNGKQIFPAMLTAIEGAKKTITFESYVYWSGKMGQRFADALT